MQVCQHLWWHFFSVQSLYFIACQMHILLLSAIVVVLVVLAAITAFVVAAGSWYPCALLGAQLLTKTDSGSRTPDTDISAPCTAKCRQWKRERRTVWNGEWGTSECPAKPRFVVASPRTRAHVDGDTGHTRTHGDTQFCRLSRIWRFLR